MDIYMYCGYLNLFLARITIMSLLFDKYISSLLYQANVKIMCYSQKSKLVRANAALKYHCFVLTEGVYEKVNSISHYYPTKLTSTRPRTHTTSPQPQPLCHIYMYVRITTIYGKTQDMHNCLEYLVYTIWTTLYYLRPLVAYEETWYVQL